MAFSCMNDKVVCALPSNQQLPAIRQPKIRNRSSRKLLFLLVLFFIILLAVLFFRSSISRISEIHITGNHYLTTAQIGQAADLRAGDHFFAVSADTIRDRVKTLPIVKTVQVNKHFPGRIAIRVEEYPTVAFEISGQGKSAILANGISVPLTGSGTVIDRPILTGWEHNELKAKLCGALAVISPERLADISEIRPDPSASYPDKIRMFTRSRFEITTTIGFLPEKMKYLDTFIYELKQKNITTGRIFLMGKRDYHQPFESSDGNSTTNDNAQQKHTTQ